MKTYPNLFSPYRIRNVRFKNRIVSAPTQLCQKTAKGGITDYGIGYFEAKARGGAAQITLGDSPADTRYAIDQFNYFDFNNPGALPTLGEVSFAIRQHGAIASAQINHCGGGGNPDFIEGRNPIGPSGYERSDGVVVQEMDDGLIERTIEKFAETAANIKLAGFDMCMLHGAHGWMLAQWLSPLSNKRRDKYGGALENRARFPIAVIDRVRERVGADFLIEYRISGSELVKGGMTLEDTITFLKMLEGKIDLVHVSAGTHEAMETSKYTFPCYYEPHGMNVHFAEAIKKSIQIPVVTAGAISDPDMAEEIIRGGKADFVAMARALIADPELPNKAKKGLSYGIRPCLRCMDCLHEMHMTQRLECCVNPTAAREFRLGKVGPVLNKRKVLIAGGGPGGMQTAVTAAERGHEVVLLEKSDALGGILKIADQDPHKADVKRYKDYLVKMVESSNVLVKLNIEATPEVVKAESPDYMIVAIGAMPIIPDISGAGMRSVITALDAYNDAKTGKKVVVIGGGLTGCEVGLCLAERGKDVTILEMTDTIANDANFIIRLSLMEILEEKVTCRTNLKCKEITQEGVKAVDGNGDEIFIKSDTVVLATGMKADTDRVDAMLDLAEEAIPIGDCVRPRKIRQAVHEGYFAAMDIE